MELNNKQIAEAFSKHNFVATFPFIADNIQWIMVGGELILGKEKVIETCEKSTNYLKTVTTTFSKFLVLDNDDYVTIDTISEYLEQDKSVSKVASCDIYKFDQGQLTEITSYCIELDKQK
jgi:hypothetical protein